MASIGVAQVDRAGLYRIVVTATPRQVPADGQSQARVRIELRDQQGGIAPDGTQFVVHTDLGLVGLSTVGRQASLTGRTSGGFAIIFVTSDAPGTATITIQAADSRSVAYIDFLPEGEAAQPEARALDITGGWVGYNLEMNLIEARGRVKIKFGKVVIECGSVLQIDVEQLALKAQDVIVRRGDMKLQGEDLYLDLTSKRAVLRRFGEERLERVFFDLLGLRPCETEWDVPADAFKLDKREADSWLVARSISLFLREKIVLRHAALWVQEQKILTFPPYWIVGLPGYTGATNTQAFGLTSSGGVAVDFPFFYRVTDRATGAIKIQRGARSSSVTSRESWSLAISEEYRDGTGVEGCFELSGLTRGDWGFQWRDARPVFDDGFSYFNLGLPDHKSLFTDATVYDYRDSGRLSLRAYYDRPQDYASAYGVVADWLTDPRQIGDHNLNYRLGSSLGMRRYADQGQTVFANEVYAELSLGSRSWGKKTSLTPQLTNIYSWDTGGYGVNSMRAEVRLDHDFNRDFGLGLDYSSEWRKGDYRYPSDWSQSLGFDFRGHSGSRWYTYVSSTYDLTNSDLYGYLSFDYRLDPKWRCGLTGTYYNFEDTQYDDLELSLGRVFGNREVSLIYSTDTSHFSLSLGGFGFK